MLHCRHCTRDLAGDEGLSSDWTLVIEQDAVRGVKAVGFTVIDGNPVTIELRRGIGRPRVERRRLGLWPLACLAVQLRSRCLIKTSLSFQSENANGLKQAQGSNGIGIGG